MNVSLIVVVALAFPLLWISVFTDRESYVNAMKLKQLIGEILQSIAEWENGPLGVIKMQAFRTYALNLQNRLGLIRGYVLLRFVTRLPGKRNIHAACAILPQFYDCIWFGEPGSRARAELLADQIKKLLK
jgi:hypothetical protein